MLVSSLNPDSIMQFCHNTPRGRHFVWAGCQAELMLAALGSRARHPLHASGHAPVETLARHMDLGEPSLIIPLHTGYARRFQNLPEFARWQPSVRLVQDGETLAL